MKRRSFLAALFAAPAAAKANAADVPPIAVATKDDRPFIVDADGRVLVNNAELTPTNVGVLRSKNGGLVINVEAGSFTLT
ncbi:hypothetical protein [Shinella kummerowiae]|uniref:hypothetical protein n=1 Tax=Shinella kummerowiae TaxID=417745 RepID=UPI0021B680FA|nr:hypothetical protein [Shinella kummerowiae]MCT7665664.1 hypothetical protein [Shinella kummerowiae]